MTVLIFIAAALLAYSNGANDNFKVVASLYGSGTTTYRTALTWRLSPLLLDRFARFSWRSARSATPASFLA